VSDRGIAITALVIGALTLIVAAANLLLWLGSDRRAAKHQSRLDQREVGRDVRELRRAVRVVEANPVRLNEGSVGRMLVVVQTGLGYGLDDTVVRVATLDGRELGRSEHQGLADAGVTGFEVHIRPPHPADATLVVAVLNDQEQELTSTKTRI
jgi:hypothetical protein